MEYKLMKILSEWLSERIKTRSQEGKDAYRDAMMGLLAALREVMKYH